MEHPEREGFEPSVIFAKASIAWQFLDLGMFLEDNHLLQRIAYATVGYPRNGGVVFFVRVNR